MTIHSKLMAAVLVGGLTVALAACVATGTLYAAGRQLRATQDAALPAVRSAGRLAERAEDLSRDLGDLNEARYAGNAAAGRRLNAAVAADFDAIGAAVADLPSASPAADDGGRAVAGMRADAARLRADWDRLRGVRAGDAEFAKTLEFDDRASSLMHAAVALQFRSAAAIGRGLHDAAGFVAWGTVLSAAYVAAVVAAAVAAGTRFVRRLDGRMEAGVRDVVIYAMARLAESRDTDTGDHVDRVQAYSHVLADRVAADGRLPAADAEFVELMYRTSPLHDIGKVGIPDAVLLKPGRLTGAEFEVMKRHSAIGAETLDAALAHFPDARFLRVARDIAATHHERFDGTGYPNGLAGEEIPLSGRIVAVADVYDALTTRRVYKPAFTHVVARDMIAAESGRHFDPRVVAAFLAVEAEFNAIRGRLAAAAEPPMPPVASAAQRLAA